MSEVFASYSEDEISAIRAYAGHGGPGFRDDAIKAHHALMDRVRRLKQKLPYGNLHFEFMREVDTPMPDLGLRATYRARIKAGQS